MSEATPRPWKFLDREDPMHALICTEDGFCGIARPIGNIYGGLEIHKEEMRANANLIVRAVNNHDALLAALISARAFIPKNRQALRDSVNAAIAAAEARE